MVPLLLADPIASPLPRMHLCLACSAHRACAAAPSLMLAAPRAAPKSTALYPVPLRKLVVKHYQFSCSSDGSPTFAQIRGFLLPDVGPTQFPFATSQSPFFGIVKHFERLINATICFRQLSMVFEGIWLRGPSSTDPLQRPPF